MPEEELRVVPARTAAVAAYAYGRVSVRITPGAAAIAKEPSELRRPLRLQPRQWSGEDGMYWQNIFLD